MNPHENTIHTWEECYKAQRDFLISYAFRMTGSLMDAEDIVQDTVSECLKYDFETIKNHRAWMTRICSNKALDLIKSAHKNRNRYVGTWLPDAIPDSFNFGRSFPNGESKSELSESLTISFLILLQTLGPVERAVFLLKEVFGYPFKDIAKLLGKSEPACRKIAERARNAVRGKQYKFEKPAAGAEQLIRQFFDAAEAGDQHQLEALLSEQSEFLSDGGGIVPAGPILTTKPEIARFFLALKNSPIFKTGYRFETGWINARPGMTISKLTGPDQWQAETIMTFEIEAQKIVRIFAQRNPEKIKALERLMRKN